MKKTIYFLGWILFATSCKKQDEWLNVKSNKSDISPSTLQNYQAILDYDLYMNDNYPGLPLVSADNYYLNYSTWLGNSSYAKNAYVWAQDLYQGTVTIGDWNSPYMIVEYANIVLEGIAKIKRTNQIQQDWDNVRGSALFYRAYAFYNLVCEFAKPYTAATAATDLGIPLRLSSDINEKSVRASVQECYSQIINDLKEAEQLLPMNALYQSRPSKVAAEALLARVYLNMDDYVNAGLFADNALNQASDLLDLNSLTITSSRPFPVFPDNPEIIFYATNSIFSLAIISGLADSTLLKSYALNDLRKTAFYKAGANGSTFKGQYSGSYAPFGGLATNELYLIRAESNARAGNTGSAMQDLNTLLSKRWKKGTFIPYTANTADAAISKILEERRKELPFTGTLRWEDLRRLNKDSRHAITIKRMLNGETYSLAPSDPRYVLPIPENEIRLSGIQQNSR